MANVAQRLVSMLPNMVRTCQEQITQRFRSERGLPVPEAFQPATATEYDLPGPAWLSPAIEAQYSSILAQVSNTVSPEIYAVQQYVRPEENARQSLSTQDHVNSVNRSFPSFIFSGAGSAYANESATCNTDPFIGEDPTPLSPFPEKHDWPSMLAHPFKDADGKDDESSAPGPVPRASSGNRDCTDFLDNIRLLDTNTLSFEDLESIFQGGQADSGSLSPNVSFRQPDAYSAEATTGNDSKRAEKTQIIEPDVQDSTFDSPGGLTSWLALDAEFGG